eukprot:6212167-Pleurochrysis_carterae.AAC.7
MAAPQATQRGDSPSLHSTHTTLWLHGRNRQLAVLLQQRRQMCAGRGIELAAGSGRSAALFEGEGKLAPAAASAAEHAAESAPLAPSPQRDVLPALSELMELPTRLLRALSRLPRTLGARSGELGPKLIAFASMVRARSIVSTFRRHMGHTCIKTGKEGSRTNSGEHCEAKQQDTLGWTVSRRLHSAVRLKVRRQQVLGCAGYRKSSDWCGTQAPVIVGRTACKPARARRALGCSRWALRSRPGT